MLGHFTLEALAEAEIEPRLYHIFGGRYATRKVGSKADDPAGNQGDDGKTGGVDGEAGVKGFQRGGGGGGAAAKGGLGPGPSE